MIWIFSDVYWPRLGGVPVTIDHLVSIFVVAGHEVGMVTVGERSAASDLAKTHATFRTAENVAFPGDQVAYFSATSLAATLPSAPDDVYVIATPGRLGMTGLGIALQRRRPAIMLYLSDVLRYSRYYRAAKPVLYSLPKVAFLYTRAIGAALGRRSVRSWTTVPDFAGKESTEHFPWPLRMSVRLLFGLATSIVTLSRKSTDDLVNLVRIAPSRISQIPSGFFVPETWRSIPEHPQPAHDWQQDFRLIYVGRLVPEKDLGILLSAVAQIRSLGVPARLTVAGTGHGELAVREMTISLGIDQAVAFLGAVPRDDLGKLYANADLLVFPSQTDTQGLVCMEAAWFGLPSLLVDKDIAELTHLDSRLVTNGHDSTDLASQLIFLWRNPDVLRLAARTLRTRCEQALEQVNKRWLALIAQLLAEGKEQ